MAGFQYHDGSHLEEGLDPLDEALNTERLARQAEAESSPVTILEHFPAPREIFSLDLEADHTIVFVDITLDTPATIAKAVEVASVAGIVRPFFVTRGSDLHKALEKKLGVKAGGEA